VNDEELKAYAELVHALTELSQSHGWEVYIDGLRQDVAKHQLTILGGALTPERYQRECGWVAGVFHAMEFPERAAGRYRTMREQLQEAKELEEEN